MTLLDEVAIYLATQGVGVIGSTLFKGLMPDTPHACVAVYEYGGQPSETGLGVDGIQFENPGLQIVARGVAFDYTGPRSKVEQAYRAMGRVQAQTLSGTTYNMTKSMQAPFVLERDTANRVRFAVNFIVNKRLSA